MAHKRMFSKDITGSDAFREMPPSSQALYFHLGMEADDDGFLDNYKGLMRAMSASDDDLKILLTKRFLILFPSKVVVVKHWLLNNTIRKDRYNETKHLDEKRALIVKENGSYSELPSGKPSGNQLATQKRIEEDRIEEKRTDKGGVDDNFNQFWKEYPRKTGKGEALRSWLKLRPSKELSAGIIASVAIHKECRDWKKDDGRFIPLPATFLNQSRWEDEVTADKLPEV